MGTPANFPQICSRTFNSYGLNFPVALPHGFFVLEARNEVEVRLSKTVSAPPGLQFVADVDGNRGAALVGACGTSAVIHAQAPPGDHTLNVSVRRDSGRHFARAISYRLHVPENCLEIAKNGYAQVYNSYRELGAALEAPLPSALQPGLHRFSLRLPQELSGATVSVVTGSSRETTVIPGRSDGTYESNVHINQPDALLRCAAPGEKSKPL